MANDNRAQAGFGPTDGVQSEASTKDAERYLAGNVDGVRVETGWSKKTRFTGQSDKA